MDHQVVRDLGVQGVDLGVLRVKEVGVHKEVYHLIVEGVQVQRVDHFHGQEVLEAEHQEVVLELQEVIEVFLVLLQDQDPEGVKGHNQERVGGRDHREVRGQDLRKVKGRGHNLEGAEGRGQVPKKVKGRGQVPNKVRGRGQVLKGVEGRGQVLLLHTKVDHRR